SGKLGRRHRSGTIADDDRRGTARDPAGHFVPFGGGQDDAGAPLGGAGEVGVLGFLHHPRGAARRARRRRLQVHYRRRVFPDGRQQRVRRVGGGPRRPLRHGHPHRQPRAGGRQGLPVRRRLAGRGADPAAVARGERAGLHPAALDGRHRPPALDRDARARALLRVRLPGRQRQPGNRAQRAVIHICSGSLRAHAAGTLRACAARRGADQGAAAQPMTEVQEICAQVRGYDAAADTSLIERSFAFAAERHAGQKRRSGEPYVVHPVGVARIISELRLDVPSVCAGLLHDCVEDTSATAEDIGRLFGTEIQFLVEGVTKLGQIPWTTREERQAENFRKMLLAMARDIRVILIKLADRVDNMRTLEHMPRDKQERIARETMEIYAPLANRLGIQWMKVELEDLAFQYLEPTDHAALVARLAETAGSRTAYITEVVERLKVVLGEAEIAATVSGRSKHLWSIYQKMKKTGRDVEQIYDVLAFRVITESVRDCYAVLGVVHSNWTPVPGRFKDFIALPKPNLYQSLHTTVIGPRAERMEVQIRTQEMHRIAEQGIAAHWKYKEQKTPGADDGKAFAWLRQLMEWQRDLKDPTEFIETVKIDLFQDEVFVFTPKGDVKALPKGSTPIDLAYAIHSQVGEHCSGARVNGLIVPLRYALRNGDTVEILASANQKPSKDWLKFVVTSRARTKIRHFIRMEQRERSRQMGRDLL